MQALAKTTAAITRLIKAYQEELISLDELRERMPELRSRESSLRSQTRLPRTNLAYSMRTSRPGRSLRFTALASKETLRPAGWNIGD